MCNYIKKLADSNWKHQNFVAVFRRGLP